MNLRTAMKRFEKFYSNKKKPKKRFVAAKGEWAGDENIGQSSKDLRKEAKKLGMSPAQLLKYRKKTKYRDYIAKIKAKEPFSRQRRPTYDSQKKPNNSDSFRRPTKGWFD